MDLWVLPVIGAFERVWLIGGVSDRALTLALSQRERGLTVVFGRDADLKNRAEC